MQIKLSDLEAEIVNLVKGEKTTFEPATCFVIEKVAFQMRNLIRQLRKNYWGVFDKPIDPQTGRKKIWTHLTQYIVESVVKNSDTDTKDVNFRAKVPCARSKAIIIRNKVREALNEMGFGEMIDMIVRNMSIDGTSVVKTWEKDGKPKARIVDLLNLYVDPNAPSLQEAPCVIERYVIPVAEYRKMGFKNSKTVQGTTAIFRSDGEARLEGYAGSTKMIEVYERCGLMPKYFITGNSDDTDDVYGKIVVSCDGNTWEYASCKEDPEAKWKPYEEAWYTRVANRWYGVGAAEKVMMEQLYINIIRNVRIVRHQVSQLGIFKLRRGSGITPAMMSKLSVNGAIQVNSMDDIEQMVMNGVGQDNYNDEANAESWARKVTSAFEAVTGESMPASTTATTSAITQQGALSTFTLIKEGFGMFLQRWIKRHIMPIVVKNLKKDDIVRCSDDLEDYEEIVRNVAEQMVIEAFEGRDSTAIPPKAEFDAMVEQKIEEFKSNGRDFFTALAEDVYEEDFDVEVYVSNEEMDKAVMVNNLIQMLPVAPEARDQIIGKVFDLFGFDFNPRKKMPIAQNMIEGMQGTPGGAPTPETAQGLTTEANTLAINNV